MIRPVTSPRRRSPAGLRRVSPGLRRRDARTAGAAPATCPRFASREAAAASRPERAGLCRVERFDPGDGQIEQPIELRPSEGSVLARSLRLDKPAFAAHYDVHVHGGGDILLVI